MSRRRRKGGRNSNARDRRIFVSSEANDERTPDLFARVIAAAALEQARLERDAQAQADDKAPEDDS